MRDRDQRTTGWADRLLGIPSDDRTIFPASVARRKGLTFNAGPSIHTDAFERAVDLAATESIDLAGLVTLRVPLAEGARAFDALVARKGIKTIVEPAAAGLRRAVEAGSDRRGRLARADGDGEGVEGAPSTGAR